MDSLNIGQRLKTVRQSRNLTLDELSEVTGVSKPMLGQIERGQSSPTVTTLWKIATGMKMPFSSLLQEQNAEYTIVGLQEQDVVSEENGAMKVHTLFRFDPVRSCEVFHIEFDSGCQHHSDKHNDGVEEYVFVIHGKLDMVLNGTKITLGENQAIRFEANIPHSYLNPYENVCSVYNLIFYRK